MRITGEKAQAVSKYAHEISGGRSGVCNLGADIGNGARVIDSDKQLVWLGQPRHAAAYYLGQVAAYREAFTVTAELPSEIREIRAEVLDEDMVLQEQYHQGYTDARFRASRPVRS